MNLLPPVTPFPFRHRARLLCTTAFVGLLSALPLASPAHAQITTSGNLVPTPPGSLGSTWSLGATNLYVGRTSPGALAIAGGSAVSDQTAYIGSDSGVLGTVTVDGIGSNWTNSQQLFVGYTGTGSLSVTNGGAVSNGGNSYIGNNAGGNGTVVVDDATLTSDGSLTVGALGTGSLSIINGGSVSNTRIGYIGSNNGGSGTVLVEGADSIWRNSDSLTVGSAGVGRLTISDGGNVTAVNGVNIAMVSNGNGTINIGAATGSAATAPGTLTTPMVKFGPGTGLINFNHTDTSGTYLFSPAISGAGSVTSNSGHTVLTGTSTYTGGTTINGGTLEVSRDANLGAASSGLTLAGGTLATTADFATSRAVTLASASGSGGVDVADGTTLTMNGLVSGNGTLTKTGMGTLTLNRANTYLGGTGIGMGTLRLTEVQAASAGPVFILPGGTLDLAFSNATFTNSILTNPLLGAANADAVATVSGTNVTLGADNSAFEGMLNIASGGSAIATAPANLGSGGVNIASGGSLTANSTGNFTFDNALSGTGTLAAANGGGTFSFGTAVGNAFAGNVFLTDNLFSLDDASDNLPTGATLTLGTGNVTSVAAGTQHVGNLTIDGGTMSFISGVPGDIQAVSYIETDTLDASATGTIEATLSNPYTPPPPGTFNSINLLAHDDANVGTKLIGANNVVGSSGALLLTDHNGVPLGVDTDIAIAQGGNTVATGTYGLRLSTAPGDGLYVNYGLKQLDLQAGQTLTLAPDAGTTGPAADMSAKITGAGSLAIDAGAGDYVSLSNTTNSFTGDTTVMGGTLRAQADNVIASSASLQLDAGTGFDLGGFDQSVNDMTGQAASTVDLANATLTLNGSANANIFSGDIVGTGALTQQSGFYVLDGASTYTGPTTINAGTLAAGAANSFSPNSAVTVTSAATLDLGGFSQTVAGLANAGHVNMGTGTTPGTALTVNGDYTGNGGVIAMNTARGGASGSPAEMLVINGGTASGNTELRFSNVGAGTQTAESIRVVQASGGATTAADAFTLGGQRYTSGGYEYLLRREGEDWFLTSQLAGGGAIYRPELPAYAALPSIARIAGLSTLGTLHQRIGETNESAPGHGNGMWGRVFGEHQNRNFSGGANVSVEGNSWGFQTGMDIYRDGDESGHRNHAGAYIAYGGFNAASVRGDILGATNARAGSLRLSGPSAGAYWTHFGPAGWYVDAVTQGSWYDAQASSSGSHIDTQAKGVTASLETGYPLRFGEDRTWQIEPQAQLVWQDFSVEGSSDNSSRMTWDTDAAWNGRLGLRLQHDSHDEQGTLWQPYGQVNLWHGFAANDGISFDGNTPIDSRAGDTALEWTAGLTAKVGETTHLYGEASYRHSLADSAQDSRVASGTVGLAISF